MTTLRSAGYTRQEPTAQRLDRNYSELLQELRVAQAGVQILFAFLLGIAFTPRFAQIDSLQRNVYVATLLNSTVAAIMFIAPVPLHRLLFRRLLKDHLVQVTARFAVTGMVFLAAAMLGSIFLVVDLVSGRFRASLITALMGGLFALFWLLVPVMMRHGSHAFDLSKRSDPGA